MKREAMAGPCLPIVTVIRADNAGQGEKRQVLPPSVTRETAREIIKKIKNSERPVINAGNGIRIGHAFDVFSRVVEKLGVPVVTGWDSEDCMPDDHPLYTGRGGGHTEQ